MTTQGQSWSLSCGSWIYNYMYNKCLSPLTLWVRTFHGERDVLDTTLCDKVRHLLATGGWFSPDTPVSSSNKTDRHDIAEILLKVALNTINHQPPCDYIHYVTSRNHILVLGFPNMLNWLLFYNL